jgi:hypothetical protein
MDFRDDNLLISFDENRKLQFTAFGCEYALDKDFIAKYKQDKTLVLDRLSSLRILLLLADKAPVMKSIFENINVNKIVQIANNPKYGLSQKAKEDLQLRIKNLQDADWENKSLKQIFSDLFMQTVWRGDFRILLNVPRKCSYLQAESLEELKKLEEIAPLFITSDKDIRILIEKEFATHDQ